MGQILCRVTAFLSALTFCSVLVQAQGSTPSQTTLIPALGQSGKIAFAISVNAGQPVKPPIAAPTGTVTLYNGSTALGAPASLSANSGFTSASFAQVFGKPDSAVASTASGALWGDFNEDGHADLLVYGVVPGQQPTLEIQIFLGRSFSSLSLHVPTFQPLAPQQISMALTVDGETPALLDVDGDGHLDLLAGNTVAYGNGDGTFGRVAVLPALASGYSQTYGADIDGDGKTDIVAVDTPPSVQTPGTVQYAFTVFHNNGGGSFTAMGPYPLAASFSAGASAVYNIFGLSFADVNGDGRLDVISQSNIVPSGNAEEPAALNVMLNLGTGFSAPGLIDTSAIADEGIISPTFADLNGDGKLDLVFSYQANTMNNGVVTLLGNGDGSFAAPVNFTLGSNLTSGSRLLPLLTEDVNADGKPDVVLGSGVLLTGNGDGTLSAGAALFTGTVAAGNPPPAYALLAAPTTAPIAGGEPQTALVFINLQASASAVFVPNSGSSATVSVALTPGVSYSLTAQYSGDGVYSASTSNPVRFEIIPAATNLTLTSSQNPTFLGGSPLISATVTGLLPGAGGTVTFTNGSTTLTSLPLTNGVASFHLDSVASIGNLPISATYSGDASNAPATGSLTQVFVAPISLPTPSPDKTTLMVTSGSAAQGSITVIGANGYSGGLGLSCTGLPADASCSFTPQVPSIGSGATTFTFYVATNSSAPVLGEVRELGGRVVTWCGVPLLGALLLTRLRRSRAVLCCLAAFAFLLVGLNGCGGNSSQPVKGGSNSMNSAPGTYTFQVNASSAGTTLSQTYTLIVQ